MANFEVVENSDENVEYLREFMKKTGRFCGECFACCVVPGINELKKWPGQTCKHITSGDTKDLTHRCSIYDKRPRACSHYYCGWLAGLGMMDWRPDKSGVLVTLYPPHDYKAEGHIIAYDPGPTPRYTATVHVIDEIKAGDAGDPNSILAAIIGQLVDEGCTDIRIMDAGAKPGSLMLHLHNGILRRGTIHKPGRDGYENLVFSTEEPPIGRYEIRRIDGKES